MAGEGSHTCQTKLIEGERNGRRKGEKAETAEPSEIHNFGIWLEFKLNYYNAIYCTCVKTYMLYFILNYVYYVILALGEEPNQDPNFN